MSKTLARPTLCIFLMISSFMAWGAVERETFEVSFVPPSDRFHVWPVDPSLTFVEQRLPYNSNTGALGPLRAPYRVKNANGAIGARLGELAYLSDGRERIDLRVKFNNVELNLESREVVSAADAGTIGKIVDLEIAAIKPAGGYPSGQYHGTVHMVFDAIAP
ncbi:CS1 type fimbrial major subunit [Pseudomonas sp. LARHCG127]|uniref:CS1 type fimbrial major subunit n=1 Tax=unclassified Pseudomonas TaxID=196821 RepID=UPI0039848784